MYSGRPQKKESAIVKYARHLGISAVAIAAVVVILVILILWWFFGYTFVLAPSPEVSFEAVNASL